MNAVTDNNERLALLANDLLRKDLLSFQSYRYVLSLLFLRFAAALAEHRERQPGVQGAEGDSWARLSVTPSINFHSLAASINPGEAIDNILEELERRNPKLLEKTFEGLNFSRDFSPREARHHILISVLNLFHQMVLLPNLAGSVSGLTFERILDRLVAAEGKRGGFFDTPSDVAHLVTEIIRPTPGESIYDPSCRSGSLLVSSFKSVRQSRAITGQERNIQDWSTCKIRMIMQGAMDATIRYGDALGTSADTGSIQKFDVVISNPPFGRTYDSDALAARYNPANIRGVRSESAFLLHMIESANEEGRIGVLLPAGVLFRGGADALIRRRIMEENLVDCVVSLPANLFYGTGISVALLVLRKGKSDQVITFIDASQSFESGRSRNRLDKKHTGEIVRAFKSKRSIEGFSYKASADEVKVRDCDLSPGIFIKRKQRGREPSIRSLESEIREIEENLDAIRRELDSCLKALGSS